MVLHQPIDDVVMVMYHLLDDVVVKLDGVDRQ